jgi:hypothetical protein
MSKRFASFAEFYPYYLAEHAHPASRRLHFIGTWLVLLTAGVAAWLREPWLLLLLPVVGYGFAWAGHFFFEHNRPATFSHPLYSLAGDWVMWKDIMTGKVRI